MIEYVQDTILYHMKAFFPALRETHAEDWPTAAGIHVPELHVAEDESRRSTNQVRDARLCHEI